MILKEKNIDFFSKWINWKVVEKIQNKSISTEENIYFFTVYKIKVGLMIYLLF